MEPKRIVLWEEGECRNVLRQWWGDLARAPGNRAELSRARDITSVLLTPAFHTLRNAFLARGYPVHGQTAERLALAAGVVARARENDESQSFPRQMARTEGDSGPRVSLLRFRRLLVRDQDDGLFRDLIRAVHLLGNTVNVPDLADAAFRFNDNLKKQWAFEYYSIAPIENAPIEKQKG
jgi:CRISPR system Cascade subunit CasB